MVRLGKPVAMSKVAVLGCVLDQCKVCNSSMGAIPESQDSQAAGESDCQELIEGDV